MHTIVIVLSSKNYILTKHTKCFQISTLGLNPITSYGGVGKNTGRRHMFPLFQAPQFGHCYLDKYIVSYRASFCNWKVHMRGNDIWKVFPCMNRVQQRQELDQPEKQLPKRFFKYWLAFNLAVLLLAIFQGDY